MATRGAVSTGRAMHDGSMPQRVPALLRAAYTIVSRSPLWLSCDFATTAGSRSRTHQRSRPAAATNARRHSWDRSSSAFTRRPRHERAALATSQTCAHTASRVRDLPSSCCSACYSPDACDHPSTPLPASLAQCAVLLHMWAGRTNTLDAPRELGMRRRARQGLRRRREHPRSHWGGRG